MIRDVAERRRSYIRDPDFRELMYRCYESPKSLEELCEECEISFTECYSMIHDLEDVGLVKPVNCRIDEEERFGTASQEYVVNRWLVKNYGRVMLELGISDTS